MTTFYNDFEANVCGTFQIFKAEDEENIRERLRIETENKQEKLYQEALKAHEAELKAEE